VFRIEAEEGGARAGTLRIGKKTLKTPAFLPVATKACIKTCTPREALDAGCGGIIVNALHVYRRAYEPVARVGLHRFMRWPGLVFTDSGGFQSIKKFPARVTDEGVAFAMPDGTRELFTPERSVEVQVRLGSDFMFALDDCPSFPADPGRVAESVRRTVAWAARCQGKRHFAIVQGGLDPDARIWCARKLSELDMYGFAIGGLCIGEPMEAMHCIAGLTAETLPGEKPRHLMGVGSPEDIRRGVRYGIDIFDSAFPTRNARHGTILTSAGKVNLGKRKVQGDAIDATCNCLACRNFSLDYLNYLFKENEPLGMRLATIHNLTYMQNVMAEIRKEITG
jgi:queuine tRNA-ribosyltransferase